MKLKTSLSFALLCLLTFFQLISSQTIILHSELLLSSPPSPSPATTTSTNNSIRSSARIRSILLGILLGSLVGFAASLFFLYLLRLLLLYANRAQILKGPVVFSSSISPRTLQFMLSNDTQSLPILGSSSIGKYYKVALDDELTVAVKVLEPSCCPDGSNSHQRRVQQELEVLARVKHRNVMSLRAYVRDCERFSLVYDYVGGGSLEDLMVRVRMQQIVLGWDLRHQISVGVVKGLRYLHFECCPRILHYRLKPSNVMLDEGYEPRLGDCGLATLVVPCLDAPAAGNAAHYVAPECFQSCRYTDKSDIYSFGMILAVLLTGRDPSDPFFSEEAGRGNLGRWLRHLQQASEAREALDKAILGEELQEEEMLMAIRIALVCLSDLPADRPSSDELVAMLTQLHSF